MVEEVEKNLFNGSEMFHLPFRHSFYKEDHRYARLDLVLGCFVVYLLMRQK